MEGGENHSNRDESQVDQVPADDLTGGPTEMADLVDAQPENSAAQAESGK